MEREVCSILGICMRMQVVSKESSGSSYGEEAMAHSTGERPSFQENDLEICCTFKTSM